MMLPVAPSLVVEAAPQLRIGAGSNPFRRTKKRQKIYFRDLIQIKVFDIFLFVDLMTGAISSAGRATDS